MKKLSFSLCLCGMLIFMAVPAQALTFEFMSDHLTGGYGKTGPFGTVEMAQDGSNVDFTVTLYDGSRFVRTGAGDLMNFKFNASSGVTLADLSGTGLTFATGAFCGDGGGCYGFGVYFTGQKTGGGAGLAGPIEFTVADATINNFLIINDKNQIFVADVISGINGLTGLIDVSPAPVPEPLSLLLLGVGLLGVARMRRFKK